MLHQFDHRFSTYEGATQSQLNVGILPQPTLAQKQDQDFVVQPRYWVEQAEVDAAVPRFPEPVATALRQGGDALRQAMTLWAAGYHLNREETAHGERLLGLSLLGGLMAASAEQAAASRALATGLDQDFPLVASDVDQIERELYHPEPVARELVERFSPKWLMGWRETTNNTNERTMIASALPRAAVGHKFLLMFSRHSTELKLALLANLNSFVLDYVARQKLGGTSMSYFALRQLATLPPDVFTSPAPMFGGTSALVLISQRAFELTYTANDLAGIAHESGVQHRPFDWDEERRFALRCEIDAAFFHLYLPPILTSAGALPTRKQMTI